MSNPAGVSYCGSRYASVAEPIMSRSTCLNAASGVLVAGLTACGSGHEMSFFVTSVRTGDGGNLGGLTGADHHCLELATAAGSRKHEWRAYLSMTATPASAAVNARDRIGRGPWFNAKGIEVAASLDDLHGPGNKLGGRTSLDERANFVPANAHDILTGSNPDGTAADGDSTCRNWTSTEGHAMASHSNKVGSLGGDRVRSLNSAHLSEGCSLPALLKLGSNARLYCFALD